MDIKSAVAKIASDCDLRTRFIRSVPSALDDYFVSGSGDLLTKTEADKASVNKYLIDGLDFVANKIRA